MHWRPTWNYMKAIGSAYPAKLVELAWTKKSAFLTGERLTRLQSKVFICLFIFGLQIFKKKNCQEEESTPTAISGQPWAIIWNPNPDILSWPRFAIASAISHSIRFSEYMVHYFPMIVLALRPGVQLLPWMQFNKLESPQDGFSYVQLFSLYCSL